MARWFDFWVRAALTAHGLQVAYWSAVSREAMTLMEEQR